MALHRMSSGLVLTALIIVSIFLSPLHWVLYVLLIAAALIGTYEYAGLCKKKKIRLLLPLSLVFTTALLWDAGFYNLHHFTEILVVIISLTVLIFILSKNLQGVLIGSAATIFGGLWIGLPMALGIIILKSEHGHFLLGFIMAVSFLTDTGAYVVGSNLGRRKLCPHLSPNKTVEGAWGGFFTAILTALVCQLILNLWNLALFSLGEVIVLGAILGAISQLGDLVESAFKRDAGVKDSGNALPGHGGILDVVDSFVFVLPLMYLYLEIFSPHI